MINASEIRALARDLDAAAHRSLADLHRAVGQSAKRLETGWRDNARTTAGRHGHRYPDSITSDVRYGLGSIVGEVGPDMARSQGTMGRGFEFGSINQPPHLDGTQAADEEEPRFQASILDAATRGLQL